MRRYIISYIDDGELYEEVVESLDEVDRIIGPNGTRPNAKATVFRVWGDDFCIEVHSRQGAY